MKYSVIDIGSNSIRLTVYKVKNGNFKILFKDKKMAGLAGYVEKGCISNRGIKRACDLLMEFKGTLEDFNITDRAFVFATASLRNIVNSDEATAKISAATGFKIDIVTGEQEALLGYNGVMRELCVNDGVFIDIGGASTEIVKFKNGLLLSTHSYRMGSLKLYKECVKQILPEKQSLKSIKKAICTELEKMPLHKGDVYDSLICTGGTARSIFKFARYLELISPADNVMTKRELEKIGEVLTGDRKEAVDVILKVDPERIHTIIPGYMIMKSIADKTKAKEIIVSSYGVREGYLCQKVLG